MAGLIAAFEWSTLWLILHILSVIVAFGPTFTFGIIAAMGQKDPQHARFAAELSHALERKLVIPVALLVPVFGALLIISRDYDLLGSEWLTASIGLYAVALAFAILVQSRNSQRMLRAMDAMPPGPPPEGAAPPAELMRIGRKLQMGGIFLTLILIVILVLMVWRPGSEFTG